MIRTLYFAVTMLAAMAAGLYAGSDAADAHSAPSSSFKQITILEDKWFNWDFRSQFASSANVDWPVTVVYYNNANINKVKNALKGIGSIDNCGSGKYGHINEGSGWLWDGDGGIKDNCGTSWSTTSHMRLYADGDDRLYNAYLSYYVIGTAHIDDCHEHGVWPVTWCHHHWVGYSEGSSNVWDGYSDQVSGWDVYPDASDLSNAVNFIDLHGSGEDHIVNNDGDATLVVVP